VNSDSDRASAELPRAVARYRSARLVTVVLLAAFLFFAVAGFFRGDYLVRHPSPLVVWPSVVFGALFLASLCVLLILRAGMRRLWQHADPITQAEYAAAGPYVPERKSLYSWGSKHEPTKPPSRPDEDPFDTPTGP